MIIPLGTDRPSKRQALITPILIGINLGVFVMMAILAKYNPDLENQIGNLGAIHSGEYFRFWQPITSAFLHGGFMHIFGNMLFLLAFGPSVEDRFGRFWFLAFYLAGGAASGFAHIALDPHPAIGASGAIAAVSGAFLVLFPRTRIKCFVIFFMIGMFMIPSIWLIGVFIVLDLFAQVFNSNNGIANLAHLGGYGFGASLSFILLITKLIPREPYDMFSILKQKKRRADFKAAHQQVASAKVFKPQAQTDPITQDIADRRAQIATSISNNKLDDASSAYKSLLDQYASDSKVPSKTLTLHRDAQYQLANHFYQTNQRELAADTYTRILDSYPNDPERNLITILLSRTYAHDLNEPIRAIELLEELQSTIVDQETKALIESDLAQIRSTQSTTRENQPPRNTP